MKLGGAIPVLPRGEATDRLTTARGPWPDVAGGVRRGARMPCAPLKISSRHMSPVPTGVPGSWVYFGASTFP